jgi:hypothetical protein
MKEKVEEIKQPLIKDSQKSSSISLKTSKPDLKRDDSKIDVILEEVEDDKKEEYNNNIKE